MRLPRVAVLVPSSDTTVEEEFPQFLAGRATTHFTRMGLPDVTPEGLAIMEDNAVAAARLLADIAAVEPSVLLAHVDGDDGADVLLASCTNLRTLGLLAGRIVALAT